MSDLQEEAERQLRLAERTADLQRRRLDAMKDPVVGIAAQLHGLLCGDWCERGYSNLCFEPGWVPPSHDRWDGWAISQNAIQERYLNAARRIYQTTRDLGLTPEQVKLVVKVVLDAKAAGDAERFAR